MQAASSMADERKACCGEATWTPGRCPAWTPRATAGCDCTGYAAGRGL